MCQNDTFCGYIFTLWRFTGCSVIKNAPANAGDTGGVSSIPGLERSLDGGRGNPLQYSCQEDPMNRGASWTTVRGVAKSQTWLSVHEYAFSPHSQTASLTKSIFSQCELVITFLHFTRNYIKTSQKSVSFSSVQFSCPVVSDSLWPHGLQHARPPCPSPTPRVQSNSCPSSQWCHPAISSSVVPVSSRFNLSQHQGIFKWVSSSHQVAKVLEFQLQPQSFQWTLRTDLL